MSDAIRKGPASSTCHEAARARAHTQADALPAALHSSADRTIAPAGAPARRLARLFRLRGPTAAELCSGLSGTGV